MKIDEYTDERLDLFGDELNRRFDASRLENAKTLDVYDVVDFVGCTPDWKYLSPDQSVFGMTVFETTNFYEWEKPIFTQGDLPREIVVKKGTILIDRTLNEGCKQKQQMENFTVIHECFHWLLHKRYFENIVEDGILCCSQSSIFKESAVLNETIKILEHQANRCAASFLMPKQAVTAAFMEAARMPQKPLPLRYMTKYVAETANLFNINFNPMKYRLQDLGFIQK